MDKEIIDESKYLRVTTPLARYAGYENVPANILEYAAGRGTRVHTYAELYAANMLFGEIDQDCIEYVQAYINWHDSNADFVVSTETRLFCEDLLIQGKPDLICSMKDKEKFGSGYWLVDLKTSLEYSKSWPLQTAAYAYLCKINNIPLEGRLIVQVSKEGTYKEYLFHDIETPEQYRADLEMYKGILSAHRYFSESASTVTKKKKKKEK
jgi:hypothetical protein